MPQDKKSTLIHTHDTFMEICIKSIAEDDLEKVVTSDIMGYGTAKDEIIQGIEDVKKLLRKQREQSSGMEIDYTIKPVFRKINENKDAAIMVDEVGLKLYNDDFTHQLDLRISICFLYVGREWKVVHWHGSIPQDSTSEDTWHIDEWKRKAEELQSLVDEKTSQLIQQNKELEIEASLERIRTTAMSMQKPDDLSFICETVFQEMKRLGFKDLRNTEIILNQDEKENIRSYYFSDYGVTGIVDLDCKTHPLILQWFYDLKKQEDAFAEIIIAKGQMKEWEEYRQSLGYVPDPKLSEAGQIFYYSYATGSGALSISSFTSLGQKDIGILKRFRNVFSLAYRRYIDIQQAEQQAREAQIEASLERIRARSMAMHSSDELGEVAKVMFDEMQKLGGDLYAFGVVLCDKHEKEVEQWHGLGEAGLMSPFFVPIDLDYIHRYRYDQWKSGVELFSIEIPSDYIEEHFQLMFELPSVKAVSEELALQGIELTIPSWEIDYGASFEHGYLLISSLSQFEEDYIFPRFAKVFEQAYTRFLDLQKAEAQAREAQIEAALEKVRSRTMAMQHSSELGDVANVLFEHLNQLVSDLWTCGFVLCEKDRNEDEWWLVMEEGFTRGFFLPNVGDYAHASLYEGWLKKEDFRTVKLEGGALQEHYDWLMGIEVSRKIFEEMEAAGIERPGWQKLHAAYFSKGYLCIITQVPCEEEEIFKRFAQVFDLTYTRFLDLKKAEEQAREAQIELSLEKIRAQVASMQESSDLFDIVVSMRHEFLSLGHKADYFWHMRWADDNYEMSMTSEDGSRIGMIITVPKFVHQQIEQLHQWEQSDHPYFVLDLDANGAWDYIDKMNTYGQYQQVDPHAPTEEDIHHIGGLTFIIARTTHGEIGFSLPGKVPDPPQESIDTLVRFAGVFDLAYRRFEDLKATERQHREAQVELALERVRARTMAMQNSEELTEVTNVIDVQTRSLGINLWSVSYNILSDDKKSCVCIPSSEGHEQAAFRIPFEGEKSFIEWMKAVERGDSFFVQELDGRELEEHYKYLTSLPGIDAALKPLEEAGISLPSSQVNHLCFFKNGILLFITYEQVPEAHDIFRRFTQVFEQTYTRFLDLKNAEAQAREAQIEAAMERIRSRSLAMRTSEEIKDVMIEIRRQIDNLGQLDLEASVVHLYQEDNPMFESIAAVRPPGESGEIVLANVFFPVDAMDQIEKMVDLFWSDKKEYTLEFDKELAEEWQQVMVEYAPMIAERRVGFVKNRRISDNPEYWNFADFSEGSLLLVTHSPASEDTKKVLRKASQVFDLAYRRFRDLQKAEARARESQIEASLERVRSRSMGMQRSEELKEVIKVIFNQLSLLEINAEHAGIVVDYKPREDWTFWVAETQDIPSRITVPYLGSTWDKQYTEAKENGVSFFTTLLNFEEKNNFYKDLLSHIPGLTDEAREFYFSCEGLAISTTIEKDIGLYMENFSGMPYSDEENDILKRFGMVFQQTYTRFLDLKRAEEQAREAQINLALERVRARTMAMHKSEELADISFELFKQVQSLGVKSWHCAFNIYDEGKESSTEWGTNEGGVYPKYTTPREGIFKKYYDIGQSGESLHVEVIGEDKSVAHYEWLCSLPGVGEQLIKLRDAGVAFPTSQIDHVAFFKYGYLIFISYDPVPEAHDIFNRFAKIFEQSYTRFLDLKMSEQQAREARIEVSLEKVRSRTMAMQKSDELPVAANLLFQEVQSLGMSAWSAGYCIWDEGMKGITAWMNSEGVIQPPFYAPTTEDRLFSLMRIAREEGHDFYVTEMGGDELVKHYEYMRSLPVVGEILDSIIESGHPLPTFQIMHYAYFTHGLLLFITYEPVPEAHEIFKRFATVFDQTYVRFLDLKRAEKQTREARIETALERVRARAMAMQEPEELTEVAQVLRTEMGKLEIEELETCSIYIKDQNSSKAECWYAIKDIREDEKILIKDQFSLDFNDTWVGRKMMTFYEAQDERVSIVMKGENRKEWIEYCAEHSKELDGYYGEVIPERTYHLYKFSNGSIGFASAGDISEESWNILTRAASAFSLAYSRFQDLTRAREDLIKLKEEKKRAEDALSNLKEAQRQLIHAEKMASLGELTAGIAHEIQNPLNFVNNFSEVSHEMIEEVREELKDGDPEEVEAILNDLSTNLEKIAHHGNRASGIVRSMLDHSRASGGEKVPTEINALCDEYLRLAYHGMRAKDRSFNVELETNFDKSLQKVKVIPQDIGRVLLNLINNAFQAVSDGVDLTGLADNKNRTSRVIPDSGNKSYTSNLAGLGPKVEITTKKENEYVIITVSDNGPGIPDDIKDKIFQPFFTTKPTGEGTGLGLSLSYDIIKAHGGEMRVQSGNDQGAEFVILIPI